MENLCGKILAILICFCLFGLTTFMVLRADKGYGPDGSLEVIPYLNKDN